MSLSWNNHGLPFLPGNTFRDVTKSAFHRQQTLTYNNGCAMPRRPTVGIGQEPLISEQLTEQEISNLIFKTPVMAYSKGTASHFVPSYVALDKKVLRYFAYFTEDVQTSPDEQFRVRRVVIQYFLEDDTMLVYEPTVENSGLQQGMRLKRQRIPKTKNGAYYLWTDLNIGVDLEIFGVKYHITHCDAFTKDFMERKGIIVNDPEPMPVDLYTQRRKIPQQCYTTPSKPGRMYQFLTMDGKVLRFFALLEGIDSVDCEIRPVIIRYYLADDTVDIREILGPNCGRENTPFLLRRQRLPKKIKPETFPSSVMEISQNEVDEYYSPKDFHVGQSITLLSHHFLLYDCDGFTKDYYQKNYPEMEMKPLEVPKKVYPLRDRNKEIPPYNGFGSLEDSLQNCLHLIPEPPKKDVLKMLMNDHKVLRYSARLDPQNPANEGRRFILSYYLSNDMISIFEKPTRNSGYLRGMFLEKARVPKPGSTVENPQFYSPADFAIGATLDVFNHRFVLTDADRYVLTYLESISSEIPSETLNSIRHKLGVEMSNNKPTEQNEGEVEEP
ncbi:EF-hand domain-containing protein 1 [Parambassis ranga]|uniref:EF-hand domain-containing protein 1 n=1 Tax=Parambassis ranga TaxID=210632 RepID=A0A6P7HRW1_9TELE|nr:EF-hand domain-containing protein 1-like [Parambassis ranga]